MPTECMCRTSLIFVRPPKFSMSEVLSNEFFCFVPISVFFVLRNLPLVESREAAVDSPKQRRRATAH